MPRNRFSESKNKTIKTGVAFCSETGKRLDNVRYDTRELIRNSDCKHTWAQDVVKALFENQSAGNENLKNTAESVLSNLHSRAKEQPFFESNSPTLPQNFLELEKRSKKIRVKKVKKNTQESDIDSDLRTVIEKIVDERLAQV